MITTPQFSFLRRVKADEGEHREGNGRDKGRISKLNMSLAGGV